VREVAVHWTEEEEKAFAEIRSVSRLTRIEAIQLWKRFSKNTLRAVDVARKVYPPVTDKQRETMAKAREAGKARRMGHFSGANGLPSDDLGKGRR
jgi:hypothetical protein